MDQKEDEDISVAELMKEQKNKSQNKMKNKKNIFILLSSLAILCIFAVFYMSKPAIDKEKTIDDDIKIHPLSVNGIKEIISNYQDLSIYPIYVNGTTESDQIYAYYKNGKCDIQICANSVEIKYINLTDNGISNEKHSKDYIETIEKTLQLNCLYLSTKTSNNIITFFNEKEKEMSSFDGHLVAQSYDTFRISTYDSSVADQETNSETNSEANNSGDESKTTLGEQNALKSALSYLRSSSFSKKGLIKQLEYEEYTKEEATYAVENCGADWNEQAEKTANSYMKSGSFSRSSLIKQLKYEGYTQKQAEHGADSVGY